MRRLLLTIPLLIAAASSPREDPPAVLAPYVNDGSFEPGDYRWLRGQFDGATPADKAADAAVLAWRARCRTADLAQTRAELASMGVSAGASLDSVPYRTMLCGQVASLPENMDLRDWDRFSRDVAIVRPIAQAFLAAVRFAETSAGARTPALADLLRARIVGEQTLRRGLNWADGGGSAAEPLPLTPQQKGILGAQIAIAAKQRDHANTEWLKGVVTSQGWPTRSKVGDAASRTAWLLVQHADADPAFQLRALRLMEPLVAKGEVDRKNYAYLYDRVMLKLVGRQRYATQLTCRAGHYVPQPLEDARTVEARRRSIGLDTLSDYAARLAKDMGPCSDAPTGG